MTRRSPADETGTLFAESTGEVCQIDGECCLVAQAGEGGHLLYGARQLRPAGRYAVEFRIALAGDHAVTGDPVCATLDVTTNEGKTVFMRRDLSVSEMSWELKPFLIEITLLEPRELEYRVYGTGEVGLAVSGSPKVTALPPDRTLLLPSEKNRAGRIWQNEGHHLPDHDLSLGAVNEIRNALNLLRPHRLVDGKKVRVGRPFDGGYVMLSDFDGIEAAYSLGINDDVSWDLDIAGRGIPIYQYDRTISALPEAHPLFHWEPKWISGHVDEANHVESLESLIRGNGHENFNNMLLKCDIEESEWPLLNTTPNRVLRQFRQIVIELHNFRYLADSKHGSVVRSAIANLTASHRVVHIHGNNFAPWIVVGGIPVPSVLEVTLMRADLGVFAPSDEIFPTPVDMPCDPAVADLYLGRFVFD